MILVDIMLQNVIVPMNTISHIVIQRDYLEKQNLTNIFKNRI